ncbi:hypothetical protein [Rhodocyclus tenuis]|uniref:chorismate transformation enzyme, FkbO/Hyg5 family n=1 Tax=Rhodocyclus tenuis TaxID=1066 RepID=UPI001903512E|nr:hypothetical protein [Rhodocyclus tenuis]
MSKPDVLCCTPFSPADIGRLSAQQTERLLGITLFGNDRIEARVACPVQHVGAPLLGGTLAGELWLGIGACRSGVHANIRYCVDELALYGVIEIDEPASSAQGSTPLQAAVADAYREIFALLDREGFPHLWRMWNYVPAINADSHGIERYRQFNIGRHQAFVDCARPPAHSPAACALGVAAGPVSIAFVAGRVAPITIENPRQLSAYAYPPEYGPRSPTFSRAVLVQLPAQELLFISGTASIVGHRTLHVGDVVAQTLESLANIAAVIEESRRFSLAPVCAKEFSYRSYIRHGEDFARVRAAVERELGETVAMSYVQADICRSDLLVEIEASASLAGANVRKTLA